MSDPISPVSGVGGSGSPEKNQNVNPSGFGSYMGELNSTAPTKGSETSSSFLQQWGLNKDDAKKFYSNLCNFIITRIKAEDSRMKQANEDLKKSETGDQ